MTFHQYDLSYSNVIIRVFSISNFQYKLELNFFRVQNNLKQQQGCSIHIFSYFIKLIVKFIYNWLPSIIWFLFFFSFK